MQIAVTYIMCVYVYRIRRNDEKIIGERRHCYFGPMPFTVVDESDRQPCVSKQGLAEDELRWLMILAYYAIFAPKINLELNPGGRQGS